MRPLGVAVGLLLAILATGSVVAAVVTVHVGSYYFEDSTVGDDKVVARVGDQLRFLIDDGGGGRPHSVVVSELGIDSGPLLEGSTFVTPVLDTPGTFTLFCRVHRVSNGHLATLVVTGTTATPKPTPAPTPVRTPTPTVRSTPQPSTPGSTSGPLPSGGTVKTAEPSAVPGASSAPGTGTAPPASAGAGTASPVDGVGVPASAAPSPSVEGLPVGVTGPPALEWLRSVLVGALALPGLVVVAAIAWLGAARRAARGAP